MSQLKNKIHNRENSASQTSDFGHKDDNKKQAADSCHEKYKANTVLRHFGLGANIPCLQTGRHSDRLSPPLSFRHPSIKEDELKAMEAPVNK